MTQTVEKLIKQFRASHPAAVVSPQQTIIRRWVNSRAHAAEIKQANKLTAALAAVDEQLLGRFQEAALNPVAIVLEDLSHPEICNHIRWQEQLLADRRSLLARHEAEVEAEERRRKLAAETPIEREIRELREEGAELREEVAELKAGLREAAPALQRSRPESGSAPMPFTTSDILAPPGSYGFSPPGPPPSAPRSMRGGGAGYVVHRGELGEGRSSTPAMPHCADERGVVSTLSQFFAACRR